MIANADMVLEAEARRLGALYLIKPVSPVDLLAGVERQLASVSESESTASGVTRRWRRQPVKVDLHARIDDSPARVLDVSYGGLRVEVDRASERLPRTFSLTLAQADLELLADLVWSSRIGDRSWQCGVALARLGHMEATRWRGLVDLIT